MRLWHEPDRQAEYTETIEIDLSTITVSAAGPRRPQDRIDLADMPAVLPKRASVAGDGADATEGWPAYPIAIAAITSCTNTSDPRQLVTAGLLARAARQRGMRAAPWVKTSLAPGSPAADSYLGRAGLLDDLSAVGFDIVGFGCTTCIGNSGPLPDGVADAAAAGAVSPVAVLSGNRNFPGRVNPDLDLAFLVSPAVVVAAALSGDAQVDLVNGVLGYDDSGHPVYLRDVWPSGEQIDAALAAGPDRGDFSAPPCR